MNRSYFLKILLALPFGGVLARNLKAGEPSYLLNRFYVAGFQYYEGPALVDEMVQGEYLELEADPQNAYDPFSVKILWDTNMLGHVPRTDNKHISRLLRQDVALFCQVTEVNPGQEPWNMLQVEIWL